MYQIVYIYIIVNIFFNKLRGEIKILSSYCEVVVACLIMLKQR